MIYGDSLILAGMQASLGDSPGVEIVCLGEPSVDLVTTLCELKPAVLIFDLDGAWPDVPLPVLQQLNLLLIGLDANSSTALVLFGRLHRALNVSDLLQVITAHLVEE